MRTLGCGLPAAAHPLRRDSERLFAFAILACAWLGYNRLPDATEGKRVSLIRVSLGDGGVG